MRTLYVLMLTDRAKIDRAINDNEVCDVNPFGVICYSSSLQRRGRVAEPTHQIFTGQFSLYAGVLSGSICPSFLSRHWREPISFGWTVTDSAYTRRNSNSDWLTKPDYGSMQEQCMGLKEKDSCAGISPAHVLHWQKD